MRILLEKTKQTELIEKAKKTNNFSWKELAEKTNLSSDYLRNEIKNGNRTLSVETYKILCTLAKQDFDNSITSVLDENWGRQLGEKIHLQNQKNQNF